MWLFYFWHLTNAGRVETAERARGRSGSAVEEGTLCNARLKELSQPSLTKRRLRGGLYHRL